MTTAAAAGGRHLTRTGSSGYQVNALGGATRSVSNTSVGSPSGSPFALSECCRDELEEAAEECLFFTGPSGKAPVDRTSVLREANTGRGCMSRLIVDPDETALLLKWDLLMIIALGFVAIMTPVEVSMLEVKIDALFVINRMVDVAFLLDMVLQFFLKYPVKTRYTMYMESRHGYIVRRYLSTWFLVDFVCIVPYDLISMISDDSALAQLKIVRALRLLRLLKLTRTLKGSRMLRRLEIQLSLSYQTMSLVKFFLMLLMVGHWMACAWCATLRLQDASAPRWVDDIDAQEQQSKTTGRPWLLYSVALYFALYTMTSMGYGDVHATSVLERGVCVLFLLVSGVCWAYIIGQVTCIVANMGQMQQQYYDMLDQVNSMMHERGIPTGMRWKLRRFFLSTKSVQRYTQQWELVSELSHGLQGQVSMMTNAVWLANIVFLRDFFAGARIDDVINDAIKNNEVPFTDVPSFVLEMSMALQFHMFASEEHFGKPHVLYILRTGLAMRDAGVKSPGAVWGEDFVLSDSTLLAPVSTLSLSYVEVLMLPAADFMHICEKNRRKYPGLPRAVRRHVVRLAFRRGILAEARRRRAGPSHGTAVTALDLRGLPCPGPPAEPAPAAPSPRHELRALQEDIASLKEVQRQTAEMMGFLAEHEALLADKLRARGRRGPAGDPGLRLPAASFQTCA